MHGNAPPALLSRFARREGLAPARLLGREIERAAVPRVLGEEGAAILDRILFRRSRKLVHDRFGGKRGVGRAHRAPPLHRHRQRRRMQFHQQVGDGVGQRRRPFDRRRIDAVLDQHAFHGRALEDRLADDAMLPGEGSARGIERGDDPVVIQRPVVTRPHVVFARPDELHRCLAADRLDDLRGLDQVVRLRVGATAEAAAGVEHVELHLLRLEAQDLRDGALIDGLELLAIPDFAASAIELHHAIHRLHRGMGQKGKFEFRFDPVRRR